MSEHGLALAVEKMRAAGVNETAVAIFSHYYRELEQGSTGLIPEADIAPLDHPDAWHDEPPTAADVEAFSLTAFVKLNGGLGTSMGLSRAKTLLPVRDGLTFLDLIARQVLAARSTYGVRLPLVLLDSFNTSDDTLAALAPYELEVDGLPLDMVQSQEPKLLRSDLTPVSWPANPKLEWCPPGHGDLYPTLLASGLLDGLIDRGFRYASVSNSDNLGCAPSPSLAGWFARTGAPYAAEVTLRTPMDVKGGHLARRRADGRLVLRETAQTDPSEMRFFTDPAVHPFAHTNNLWFDLVALKRVLTERGGVLGLTLIRNAKTVDPLDASSPEVYQIESAMGAAVGAFEGSTAVAVPRSRFIPVKTTNELALLRSDVYELGSDFVPRATVARLPVVSLAKPYAKITGFESRLPYPLGLHEARTLTVDGDWTFGEGVSVQGDVTLGVEGGAVPDGTVLGSPEPGV